MKKEKCKTWGEREEHFNKQKNREPVKSETQFKPVTQDFADGFVRGLIAGKKSPWVKNKGFDWKHPTIMIIGAILLVLCWYGIFEIALPVWTFIKSMFQGVLKWMQMI